MKKSMWAPGKTVGGQLDSLLTWAGDWRRYNERVEEVFAAMTESDRAHTIESVFRGTNECRRSLQKHLWDEYGLDPRIEPGAGVLMPMSSPPTPEEIAANQDAAYSFYFWGVFTSAYNMMADAKDEALDNSQDVPRAMSNALRSFFLDWLPRYRSQALAMRDEKEAVASLAGWLDVNTSVGFPRLAPARTALLQEYESVAVGKRAALASEAAFVLLGRLRRAEAGEVPGDFNDVKKTAMRGIEDLGEKAPTVEMDAPGTDHAVDRAFAERESFEQSAADEAAARLGEAIGRVRLNPSQRAILEAILAEPCLADRDRLEALAARVQKPKKQVSVEKSTLFKLLQTADTEREAC